MSCKHENLRTVNNRLFCKDCKKELPIEFLTGGGKPEESPEENIPVEETPAETVPTEETPAETVPVDEIPAEIPPVEKKTGKSPAKKRTPKKAE